MKANDLSTLLICPNDNIARAYRQHFGTAPEAAQTIEAKSHSVMGYRADRVIVLPFLTDSRVERESFDRLRREHFPCRVKFGGTLIDLNDAPPDMSSATLREAIVILEGVAARKEHLAGAERHSREAKAAGDKHRVEAAAIRLLIRHAWK